MSLKYVWVYGVLKGVIQAIVFDQKEDFVKNNPEIVVAHLKRVLKECEEYLDAHKNDQY